MKACRTPTFLSECEYEVTMSQIIEYYDFIIPSTMSAINLFDNCVDLICTYLDDNDYGGLAESDVRKRLLQMTTFDYLICNCDRHFSNFGLIVNDRDCVARMCPLFDHGQSFLLREGGLSHDGLVVSLRKYKSRPFSTDPDKNIISFDFAYGLITESNLEQAVANDDSFYASVVKERIKGIYGKANPSRYTNCFGG